LIASLEQNLIRLSMVDHQLTEARDSQSPLLRPYLDNLGVELLRFETILSHNVDFDIPALPTFTQTDKPSAKIATPHDEKIDQAFAFFNDLKMSDLSQKSTKAVVEADGRKSCV